MQIDAFSAIKRLVIRWADGQAAITKVTDQGPIKEHVILEMVYLEPGPGVQPAARFEVRLHYCHPLSVVGTVPKPTDLRNTACVAERIEEVVPQL